MSVFKLWSCEIDVELHDFFRHVFPRVCVVAGLIDRLLADVLCLSNDSLERIGHLYKRSYGHLGLLHNFVRVFLHNKTKLTTLTSFTSKLVEDLNLIVNADTTRLP